MPRLTLDKYREQCKSIIPKIETPVIVKETSWLDRLPSKCDLISLFQTGKTLEECLDLVGTNIGKQNKCCRESCHTTCQKCHKAWSEASKAIVLQRQVEKASSGDSQMLQWYGKAILRQQEPQVDTEECVPTVINISGIDANQEQEIDNLKRELAIAYRKLNAIETHSEDVGSSDNQ